MDGSDFISFGNVDQKASFDAKGNPRSLSLGGERKGPKTKEERRDIARAVRLAAKKAKKKVKSDAKKQRAQNAILHRRLTKNSEKYVKNKERNRLRDIDAERYKIRKEAVRQAERLAAKHDPSGKSFNVGEVVVLEDGNVCRKDSYKAAEATRLAKERGEKPEPLELPKPALIEGVNPERLGRIHGIPALDGKTNMSKTAQRKLLDRLPKPIPPKPIIPAGVEIPEGEENWVALWDINDDDVLKRISKAKSDKKNAARKLRRQQQEQKKFNKALKVKKKISMKKGVPWDPIKATKEILGEQSMANKLAEADADAEKRDGGDWKSDSSSDSGSGGEEEADPLRGLKEAIGRTPEPETKMSKMSKRSAEEVAEDEPAAKKSKKSKSVSKDELKLKKGKKWKSSSEDVRMEDVMEKLEAEEVSAPEKKSKSKSRSSSKDDKSEQEDIPRKKENSESKDPDKSIKKANKSQNVTEDADDKEAVSQAASPEAPKKEKMGKVPKGIDLNIITAEGINARVKLEEKRARKIQKKIDKKAKELLSQDETSSKDKKKKRKHSTTEDTTTEEPEMNKKDVASAGRWNPEALNGDAKRKSKFLRLLGGKKGGNEVKVKSDSTVGEIQHVANELERQFEKGTMRKNGGEGKRRGLGA